MLKLVLHMIKILRSANRGFADHGWLKSWHTFSFADYYNPEYMGYGPLRVINQDIVDPERGFETHPHKNMEIISFIVEGALTHQDSMGNKFTVRPSGVQYMSAGSGVMHSEKNLSVDQQVHLLQIWILPNKLNLKPRYEDKTFDLKTKGACLLASLDGRENSIQINQDANLYHLQFGEINRKDAQFELKHVTDPKRKLWLQVIDGDFNLEDQKLGAGDGAEIEDLSELNLKGRGQALLFDMG